MLELNRFEGSENGKLGCCVFDGRDRSARRRLSRGTDAGSDVGLLSELDEPITIAAAPF